MTLADRIRTVCEKNNDRIAYVSEGESISYGELLSLATKQAEKLRREKSPVVFYSNKKVSDFVLIVACIFAGVPYVPIDSAIPLDRYEKVKEMCKTFSCPENTAYIIFTSGSTGVPKGVPISYDNLLNFTDWINAIPALSKYENCNVFNMAGFGFDLSVADIFYSLSNGHTLTAFCGDPIDGFDRIFQIFRESRIEVSVTTPSFMKLCLLNKDFNHENFPDFSCAYFCGELLEKKTVKKLFERFPEIRIINAYGPTEATSAVSYVEIEREMLDMEILPVGREGTHATGIETLNGEIVLSGASVFSGYIDGQKGGHSFEKGKNIYRTGDIGYVSDGYLFCRGRMDSTVKYKGYRIDLCDVEENIKAISEVTEAFVFSVKDGELAVKSLKAYVTVSDSSLTADAIREYLCEKIPPYMIPKTIAILESVPLNKNGKVDRKALENL